ncbi:MAG: radical SAM protein [Deltaproteobacteria bacterium]|nr:radical SAM protein [Deltaproteobacteria bacterium]
MMVSEIFLSIQGESTYAGLPCIFVRLAGCNLECKWCDTAYARDASEGYEMTVDDVVGEVKKFKPWLVEITGGEPLLQADAKKLAHRLLDEDYTVLLETNGSADVGGLDERVVKIIDVKCPSSGHEGVFLMENLDYITQQDEVKFVIGDRGDYDYAKKFMEDFLREITARVLFAPVRPRIEPSELADWILKDGLKVRLQLQLHSYIWEEEKGR